MADIENLMYHNLYVSVTNIRADVGFINVALYNDANIQLDTFEISNDGIFQFPIQIKDGDFYDVRIVNQSLWQGYSIVDHSGFASSSMNPIVIEMIDL